MSGIMDGIMESGAGGRWFKFERVGDTIAGDVVSISERQVRDFTTKMPEFWDDGEPKVEVLFALRTNLPAEDADDDGVRVVRVKGWGVQRNALREACQTFGRVPREGDRFVATYTGQDNSRRGGFPAKVYTYHIVENTAPVDPANIPF